MSDARPSRIRTWVMTTRPWSFTMTALSVTLGSIAVPVAGGFSWAYFLAALFGMIFAHAATNVLNDYFDHRHGVDRPGAPTTVYRRHPLVESDMTPRGVLVLSMVLYAAAAACGAYLFVVRGPVVLLIALAGALASVFYTAGPVKYKYRALGEVSVFLVWGPAMTLGAFYVQHGSWDGFLTALLVSIPQGLWVALVILANNLKDIGFDGESDIRTVGTMLGRKGTLRLFTVLAILAYATSAGFVAFGLIPVLALAVLISAPRTIGLVRHLAGQETIPADADPQTAQTGMIFGVLLAVALGLTPVMPW